MPLDSKLPQETELGVLKEILRWVKFSGMKEVRGILTSTPDTGQKMSVYQLSDGSKGIIEIGKAVGIKSSATIFRFWKQWAKLGLGETIPVPGGQRFKRSFDLEDFGFDVQIPGEKPESEQGGTVSQVET
ncbi:MAG: hypothetical protein JRN68_06580 [Nitrososphaerota archaeon]|nr:hypothetical protein [Nitrososphaerota archaeon]